MSSSTDLAESASRSCRAPANFLQSIASYGLRGGVSLILVRPGGGHSVPLTAAGSYFCVGISGTPVLRSERDQPNLKPCRLRALHILRQPCGRSARRVEFAATASIAVIVHFPTSWCAGCPRGPGCQVAHFLTRGDDAGLSGGDLEIELDERGLSHARALLGLSFDEDADMLAAEQSVLALLAWAYATHSNPQTAGVQNQSLPPRTMTRLRLAADILSQRLDDPPTIAELSVLVGMNECDLKRCFKCRFGDSIASFSRNKRLAAAQGLLLHSDLGIAEIALEAGFANPSQFARAFRRQFDVNPAQYRRSPRNRGR